MPARPVAVYLAGPIQHAGDDGEPWRDRLQAAYGDDGRFILRSPLDKYDVPVADLTVMPGPESRDVPTVVDDTDIVEGDKAALQVSDAVLVGYTATRSVGTPMEVMWAHERDYPIVIWAIDGTPAADMSPWYRYHADRIVADREQAMATLAECAFGTAPTYTVPDGDSGGEPPTTD